MYIVEIVRQNAELHATMIQIRTWVKDHRVAIGSVELAFLRDREIRFRLQCQNASDASAIARFLTARYLPNATSRMRWLPKNLRFVW